MMKHFSTSSFIAGSVLGALLVGAWFLGSDFAFPPTFSSQSIVSNTENRMPESSAVSVADQRAGLEVIVESVTAPPSGVWIAVRETNGSTLGNVLGAARVGGSRTEVSIPLLRTTLPGRSYAIELYRDDNNSAFGVGVNSVYIDFDTSAPVIAYFKTTD